MNKLEAIAKATGILKKRFPEINLQDYIASAWKNSCKLEVRFRRKIKFIPLGCQQSDYQYDITVDLVHNHVHPLETIGMKSFYKRTSSDKEKIGFIRKFLGFPIKNLFLVIVEDADRYDITLKTDQSFSRHFMDNVSGKEIMAPLTGSYNVPVVLPGSDPLIEIVE